MDSKGVPGLLESSFSLRGACIRDRRDAGYKAQEPSMRVNI